MPGNLPFLKNSIFNRLEHKLNQGGEKDFMGIDDVVAKAKQAAISGRDLVKALASGESPSGQFRVKWLRRLLVAWWVIAFAITAILLIGEIVALTKAASYAPRPRRGFEPDIFTQMAFGYAWGWGVISLIYELWVMAALLFLAKVWGLRKNKSQQQVKAWLIVGAVALIFGRITGFWWAFLFGLIPNFWLLYPIKFIVLPPITLLIGGLVEILTVYFAVTAGVLLFVVLPMKIYQAAFGISNALFIAESQKSPFFSKLLHFWYWFTGKELPQVEPVPDDSKGARFATMREIVEQANTSLEKNPQAAAVFGHINGSPLPLYTDKHILIMASTRSGKGVSLIIPHLLRYEGSAFVLDPKGENGRATGRRRAELNGKVHYLDPFGITGKPQARFNPLARFTPENMEAESKALAAALVMGERGVRDHWSASAQQLITSIILHVVTSPNIPPEHKDLPTVRRLVLKDLNKAFKDMLASDAADGLVSSLAASFVQTPERELGSIISTAQRETEILDNPSIIACLKAAGPGAALDFAEWHSGTMTVYLCLSAPKFPVFSRWLRLVLTSALDEMTDKLTPPTLPVCFMLDELATLGHLAAVENAVGLAAGYGIQLVTVFQDVAQMKDLYKGRWASFIGNAGVRALFSLDDYDSAKYWSNFLGGHLVETHSQAQDIYGLAKGQTMGEALRPLLSPEELMLQFAQGKMLVLPQGSRPIVSDRVAYWQDAGLNGLWDDPRGPLAPPVSSGDKKDYKKKK
jgi:type IV secretion system protein VirD4